MSTQLFVSADRVLMERRDFFRVLGGGLFVAIALTERSTRSRTRTTISRRRGGGRGGRGRDEARELAAWLHIDEQGRVTAYTGKVEIGQNIRTSLAQTIADELRVPLAAITMVMADTDLTPYDAGTFGSQTTPRMARQLARASATAREMLIDLAAERWKIATRGTVDVSRVAALSAKDGRVVHADGRVLTYGELTKGQKLTGVVAEQPAVSAPAEWKVRGTAAKKVNGRVDRDRRASVHAGRRASRHAVRTPRAARSSRRDDAGQRRRQRRACACRRDDRPRRRLHRRRRHQRTSRRTRRVTGARRMAGARAWRRIIGSAPAAATTSSATRRHPRRSSNTCGPCLMRGRRNHPS